MLHVDSQTRKDETLNLKNKLKSIMNYLNSEFVCNDNWFGFALRQVEINMIASSFGGLMPKLVLQHRIAASLFGINENLNERVIFNIYYSFSFICRCFMGNQNVGCMMYDCVKLKKRLLYDFIFFINFNIMFLVI